MSLKHNPFLASSLPTQAEIFPEVAGDKKWLLAKNSPCPATLVGRASLPSAFPPSEFADLFFSSFPGRCHGNEPVTNNGVFFWLPYWAGPRGRPLRATHTRTFTGSLLGLWEGFFFFFSLLPVWSHSHFWLLWPRS